MNWFSLYPEYSQHKFYITGESYAGIYIPMLMQQIDLNPIALAPRINLIGAAVSKSPNVLMILQVRKGFLFRSGMVVGVPQWVLVHMEPSSSKFWPSFIMDTACILNPFTRKSKRPVEIGVVYLRGKCPRVHLAKTIVM